MSRIISEHFNDFGKPKKSYPTRTAALKAAQQQIIEKYWTGLEPYKCSFCGEYHVGHAKR